MHTRASVRTVRGSVVTLGKTTKQQRKGEKGKKNTPKNDYIHSKSTQHNLSDRPESRQNGSLLARVGVGKGDKFDMISLLDSIQVA